MTTKQKNAVRIPYVARNYISRYSPLIRQRAYEIIAQRQAEGNSLATWKDLYDVISATLADFESSGELPLDEAKMARAKEAAQAGRGRSTREIVNEMRAEMAGLR